VQKLEIAVPRPLASTYDYIITAQLGIQLAVLACAQSSHDRVRRSPTESGLARNPSLVLSRCQYSPVDCFYCKCDSECCFFSFLCRPGQPLPPAISTPSNIFQIWSQLEKERGGVDPRCVGLVQKMAAGRVW